ncbi:EAL domain-containing protein [Cohnella lupini]|uniref:PAS domain S-box-containing protein/diguanylate cyclase (GGDEF)-like protein n=1 Tax=Cohnella lupini TaxID=1294267 RepID=A0A3D9HTD1_9BACL|nr:EAL domain-containing protein [Cohnella lupini]RED52762.1 PAS domain S-box-containing protein/diguanylate cyclase (GGDEF)-like protein [Cohnella lupini]
MNHIHGSYNISIVILSYLVAVVASYAALDLAGRVSAARNGKNRAMWLFGGAIFMGFGIWGMHFVGMLAYKLSIPVSYDFAWVVLSIVVAVLASLIALHVVGRDDLGIRRLLLGGTLMAIGITAMHYTGMTAMRVGITYDPILFSLSVAIALAASVAALWLSHYFRRDHSWKGVMYKLGSGLVMGAAIAGMHYTGMAAARFHKGNQTELLPGMKMNQEVLAYVVALGTVILLSFVLFVIFFDKRLSSKDQEIVERGKWYKSLYENHLDGIITIDIDNQIVDMNPAVSLILGIRSMDYINQPASALLELHVEQYREQAKQTFVASLRKGQPQTTESVVIHREGHLVHLSTLSVPVNIEEDVKGTYLIIRDITEEKRAKETIQQMAYHDELTGLPNRRLLMRTLEEAIRNEEAGSSGFGVLVMDIDRFKMINDSLGHAVGDQFLRMVTERITQAAAGMNVMTARMGGDEFTLICHGDPIRDTSVILAQRLIDYIQIPYRLKDNDFYVTASIGIAIYPHHAENAEYLLKNADTAMYEVKRNGKNGFQFYSSQFDEHVMEKIELEGALRKAVERNELLVHYQPQISIQNEQVIGVEALLRWIHPEKGLIPPGTFIPIAEETGMIGEIGAWVLREACRQMQQWQSRYGWNVPVSVNLSTQQFHQENLVGSIKGILEETGLKPEYLEIEITESMMMDAIRSSQILRELTELGIRISMDDFGTGYSSLSYLKMFPIQKLKIDRSFIKDITRNEDDRAIVATIIAMAHNLKMDVIAEGVETKEQLDFLMNNGCDDIQGYYFSKPLSSSDVESKYLTIMDELSKEASS